MKKSELALIIRLFRATAYEVEHNERLERISTHGGYYTFYYKDKTFEEAVKFLCDVNFQRGREQGIMHIRKQIKEALDL